MAKKLPGLERFETSKVFPKEDGSSTPFYRMVDMYFADYDAASAAVTTMATPTLALARQPLKRRAELTVTTFPYRFD